MDIIFDHLTNVKVPIDLLHEHEVEAVYNALINHMERENMLHIVTSNSSTLRQVLVENTAMKHMLEKAQDELHELKTDLEMYKKTIQDYENEISKKNIEIADLNEQIENQSEQIENQRQTLAEYSERLSNRR